MTSNTHKIKDPASLGIVVRNGSGSFVERQVIGEQGITVVNNSGEDGDISIGLSLTGNNGVYVDYTDSNNPVVKLIETPNLPAGTYKNITSLTCDGNGRVIEIDAEPTPPVPTSSGMAVYTAANIVNFAMPNVSVVKVTLVAGGGGGAAADDGKMGGGGGGGATVIARLTIDPTATYSAQIGFGGAGGASASDNTGPTTGGFDGGATMLMWGETNALVASGGAGGALAGNGGIGGSTSINFVNIPALQVNGSGGGAGGTLDTTGSGIGGSSAFGGGGAGVVGTSTGGIDGNSGGGGSGGSGAYGGAGGEGFIMLEW